MKNIYTHYKFPQQAITVFSASLTDRPESLTKKKRGRSTGQLSVQNHAVAPTPRATTQALENISSTTFSKLSGSLRHGLFVDNVSFFCKKNPATTARTRTQGLPPPRRPIPPPPRPRPSARRRAPRSYASRLDPSLHRRAPVHPLLGARPRSTIAESGRDRENPPDLAELLVVHAGRTNELLVGHAGSTDELLIGVRPTAPLKTAPSPLDNALLLLAARVQTATASRRQVYCTEKRYRGMKQASRNARRPATALIIALTEYRGQLDRACRPLVDTWLCEMEMNPGSSPLPPGQSYTDAGDEPCVCDGDDALHLLSPVAIKQSSG
ncbi:uncharacterized protein [Triticum aestivum]|uniref:uncharacterized protein n=1 Tax=Triticum aestivum TaxID=4565 RepID=UPI001D02A4FD|nr:uncharacterized protein LOC123084012 [Triticum aestivum]